jgi:galactose mutarotase-like enzyme
MGVQSRPFGEFRSSEGYVLSADAFDLTNSRGVTATLTNWGATLTGLRLPGRDAKVKLSHASR